MLKSGDGELGNSSEASPDSRETTSTPESPTSAVNIGLSGINLMKAAYNRKRCHFQRQAMAQPESLR